MQGQPLGLSTRAKLELQFWRVFEFQPEIAAGITMSACPQARNDLIRQR